MSEESATRTRRATGPRLRLVGGAAMAVVAAAIALPLASAAGHGASADHFERVNLVSDIPGVARVTDPNLVNPWGLAAGANTPLWVSDNGADVATLYSGDGASTPPSALPLVVQIPGGAPTGQVFNTTGDDFPVGSGPALFIFASESGQITAWNKTLPDPTQAVSVATTPDAVYKGLALARAGKRDLLYATNFHAGTVDVFDSAFKPTTVPGGFTDPNLPANYAPFGIQAVGNKLYVSYALQLLPDKKDDQAGPGNGFVDVFTTDGHLVRRLISNGALNSPWGMAIAPPDFGPFGGDLLVGNFGDGAINAYNPQTGALLGPLQYQDGSAVNVDGLWGLRFGNGTFGDPGTLFFSAGIDGEAHGLLGTLSPED